MTKLDKTMPKLRTVFMGTPDFAVPSLEALLRGPDELVAVVTQPDRAAGRGKKPRLSPVKTVAVEAGVPVLQPERLRGEVGTGFRAELKRIAPDLIVVAAFGQILPKEVLNLPPRGCINVHASLLPRWRGASPIQWALAAGDETSGVSIMTMDEGLDTGPVILRRSTPVRKDETAGTLHDRLSHLGAEALVEALDMIRQGKAKAEMQDDEEATYAPMLSREDGRLDFKREANELERRVRAFQPWPGSFFRVGDKLVKVHRATVVRSGRVDAEPGTVLAAGSQGIDIACSSGALRLIEVQPEGKRRMDAAAYLAGHASDIAPGNVI